jgi:hypothetical protein
MKEQSGHTAHTDIEKSVGLWADHFSLRIKQCAINLFMTPSKLEILAAVYSAAGVLAAALAARGWRATRNNQGPHSARPRPHSL